MLRMCANTAPTTPHQRPNNAPTTPQQRRNITHPLLERGGRGVGLNTLWDEPAVKPIKLIVISPWVRDVSVHGIL